MRFKFSSVFLIICIFCFTGTLNTSIAAKKKLSEKIAQLEFKSIAVGDALKILTEHSDLNIIASQKAAEIKVTMYLKDITALDVIDAIAKTYNLWYKHDKRSNIIRIYTVKEYRLEQVEFKPEQTKIYTLKNSKNAIDLADTVCSLYGSERVIVSFGSNEDELINDLSSRLSRFDLINSATGSQTSSISSSSNDNNSNDDNGNGNSSGGSSNCIRNSGGGNNSSRNNSNNRGNNRNSNNNSRNGSSGSNNNSESLSNNSLNSISSILNDINSKNEDLRNILSGNSRQSNAFLNRAIRHQAPINVSVIKRQNRVLVRTRDAEAMKQITDLHKEIDTESSMLLMEVKILSIDLSDGYDSLFDFKVKSDKAAVSGGQSVTSSLAQTLETAASAFNPALLAAIVSDKFEARLQLLEKENRVTEVATPILMTTNQEVSRVFIGENRPIVTNYTAGTIVAGDINSATIVIPPAPEITNRDVGTTLFLTPNINADRTVGIRILIEQSTISNTPAIIPVPITGTSDVRDVEVAVVQTQTFSGTVVAKDGTSIAVGGFIEESAIDNESKVPILGDIPGLGFFFKEQANLRGRKELVVIIRPYITTSPKEASLVSKQYLEKTSIHPSSPDVDNLDIYSNNDKRHKGYQLEKPFKEYDLQDKFDGFHDKGERSRHHKPTSSKKNISTNSKQKIYVDLTQYAAKSVRLSASDREVVANIKPSYLKNTHSADLLYDSRIKAIPVASWHQGGIHVTAIALYNLSNATVNVDFKNVKGKWLASSIENAKLTRQGAQGDTTYLYLVSAGSFNDVSEQIKLSKK